MRISGCQKTAREASKKHTPSPSPNGGQPLAQGLSQYLLKEANNILNLSDANLWRYPPTTENCHSRGMYLVGGGGMGGGYGKRMEFFSNSSAEGMHIFSRKVSIYMCKLELSTRILWLPMLRSSVVNIKYFLLKFLITDFWPFLGRSSHMIHDHSVRLFYSRKFASISCFSPTIRVILLGQSQVCFANIHNCCTPVDAEQKIAVFDLHAGCWRAEHTTCLFQDWITS